LLGVYLQLLVGGEELLYVGENLYNFVVELISFDTINDLYDFLKLMVLILLHIMPKQFILK